MEKALLPCQYIPFCFYQTYAIILMQKKIKWALITVRGLSLFFKLLPISNTSVCAAYSYLATIHFRHGVLLLLICLLIELIWLQLGQTKWPHCMLAPATNTISGFKGRKMSQLPTRLCGQGHWIPKLHRLCPFRTPINKKCPL